MVSVHPILLRQIKRAGLTGDTSPNDEQWRVLIAMISQAYKAGDEERYLMERSLTVSSREMNTLHETLRHQRDYLRTIVDSLDDGIMVFDANLTLVELNPEGVRLTGITPALMPTVNLAALVLMPEVDERIKTIMRSFIDFATERPGYSRVDDVPFISASNEMMQVSVSYIPVVDYDVLESIVVVIRDISELKKYELELRHSQKLEAVGQLAAGIAHEINTPVQFVSDNLRFFSDAFEAFEKVLDAGQALHALASAVDPMNSSVTAYENSIDDTDIEFFRDDIKSALGQSADGMERVATIVRAMKIFAHPGTGERTPADLNAAIESTIIVARNEFKFIANLNAELGELPLVPCFLGDVNQVFLNLLVNASHAISDRVGDTSDRGLITVRTFQDGAYAVVEISDTGTGIPNAAQAHIFEPFFTTKEVGRGTGQGLALAYSIITEVHGGLLTFTTEDGIGTTFTVRLPLTI